MKIHSFKNYSSGKKGAIFLGGHPNLRRHSFKNASKIIDPEKKELYFWEGPSNLKKHSLKNYISGKKGTIFLGGSPKPARNTASKIKVPEKKELYFWKRHPNVQKKTASPIIVQEKKELYFWRGLKPEKTQLPKL